jgi:polysaccharide biosynthesis/export protein
MHLMVRSAWDWEKAKPIRLVVAILYFCLCTPAQQKYETPQQTNQKIRELSGFAHVTPVDTPIGVGDLIHIDVFDVPELSRDVRVSDTGDIGYPLIPGKIQAAGLSQFQLEEKLQQLLVENGLVAHPQVSVFVREQNSQPITVVGAVSHPVVYEALRPTTLLELLAAAGGVSDNAGSEVLVTRRSHSESPTVDAASASDSAVPREQTITIRLQDLIESGNPAFNIPVYGGDVVSVPQAGIVYVMGAGVAQPGARRNDCDPLAADRRFAVDASQSNRVSRRRHVFDAQRSGCPRGRPYAPGAGASRRCGRVARRGWLGTSR